MGGERTGKKVTGGQRRWKKGEKKEDPD